MFRNRRMYIFVKMSKSFEKLLVIAIILLKRAERAFLAKMMNMPKTMIKSAALAVAHTDQICLITIRKEKFVKMLTVAIEGLALINGPAPALSINVTMPEQAERASLAIMSAVKLLMHRVPKALILQE